MSRLEGRPVVRSPEQLRLHRALEEVGWTGVIDEFNDAARLTNPLCNRADPDHDERDDSRWLWALAVSGFRRVGTKSTASSIRSARTKP